MVLYDWARANGHALLSNFIFNIHTGICHLDRSMEIFGQSFTPFPVILCSVSVYITQYYFTAITLTPYDAVNHPFTLTPYAVKYAVKHAVNTQ